MLDPSSEVLPPSLYDITTLPSILTSGDAGYTVSGTHVFQKELYQKYFGKQYLTADLVASELTGASYTILPFTVLGAEERNAKARCRALRSSYNKLCFIPARASNNEQRCSC